MSIAALVSGVVTQVYAPCERKDGKPERAILVRTMDSHGGRHVVVCRFTGHLCYASANLGPGVQVSVMGQLHLLARPGGPGARWQMALDASHLVALDDAVPAPLQPLPPAPSPPAAPQVPLPERLRERLKGAGGASSDGDQS